MLPTHGAIQGIDEAAFLRAVVGYAKEIASSDLAGVFDVGYWNGGHLVFRLALEAPGDFDAFAAIGAEFFVCHRRRD